MCSGLEVLCCLTARGNLGTRDIGGAASRVAGRETLLQNKNGDLMSFWRKTMLNPPIHLCYTHRQIHCQAFVDFTDSVAIGDSQSNP